MIVSIDGLPGVGKTTLGLRLSKRYNIECIPELYLPKLARCQYGEQEFIQNDIYKIHRASELEHVILDRSFCSTVAFKMALTQQFSKADFYEIKREFYADEHIVPDLMIFIMSPPEISLIGLKKRREDEMFSYEFLQHWNQSFWCASNALKMNGTNLRCIEYSKTPFYRSIAHESI